MISSDNLSRFARLLPLGLAWILVSLVAYAEKTDVPAAGVIRSLVASEYTDLEKLYRHLHANPELSFQEKNTSARLASELRAVGFDVTEGVGGHGIVGVMSRGAGPTVLVRTDTDALPVQEETGLEWASRVRAVDDLGTEVPVMHACGHDVHMTCFVGTARVLAAMKDGWTGTLVFIAQPAEERGAGARAMLADGLYEKFPRPDYALALHVDSSIEAGTVGFTPGFAMANVDSVDITVRGIGGHGAYPETTKDPVVIASQIVVALQTIVSREIRAIDPAVVTVGSIHGGTKHNIIPDEVRLQLTVRSYSDSVREQLLSSIRRIAVGVGRTAGLPEELLPEVRTMEEEYTPSTYNDPALVGRVTGVFRALLGEENVTERESMMGGEDFGRYGREEPRIPIFMYRLGSIGPERFRAAVREGKGRLPSLHSGYYHPDAEPTIRTGVLTMSAAVLELLAP